MSSRIALSKTQKALLAWSTAFLILAQVIKYLGVEGKAATRIGLIEVMLAIATGIAFGVAASSRNE
ncbi:MAG TPA: hypothetical protein VNI02_06670 [Blastocatellia bacterium]|nr:hypothetical protein [Blastocatellia bacterium]